MAEIPIEKKSGLGWLWLLLAALLIALLAWWLLSDDDEVDGYVENDTVAMADANVNDTVDAFIIGESVDLDGARVTELTGDMSFMIESEGRSAFVVFNQEPTPNDPTEGEFDINVGQLVDIDGRVMSAADPLPEGVDASIPSGMDSYIFADSLDVENRPAN
ncbi:hypothetical protein PF049_02625 [Erythrobacteraceae bacterium WH01K]|nr:hypothetical protein PF049_02625 [Erythrobacteraceae bacterium WH01K]